MQEWAVRFRFGWVLALASVSACGDGPTTTSIPADRVGRWQLDIDSFAGQLTELHPNPFDRIPRSRFESELATLRASVASLPDPAVVVGLMRILGLVSDAHTTIDLQSFTGFRQLPLRFEWFEDGIFVIGATGAHRQALGLRLVRVGDAPVDAVVEALAEVIPHENDSWLRFSLVSLLTIPEVLEPQSLIADASRVRLELQSADGSPVEIEIPALQQPAPKRTGGRGTKRESMGQPPSQDRQEQRSHDGTVGTPLNPCQYRYCITTILCDDNMATPGRELAQRSGQ